MKYFVPTLLVFFFFFFFHNLLHKRILINLMKSNLFFSFVDIELLVYRSISWQIEGPDFTLIYSSSKSFIGLAFNL